MPSGGLWQGFTNRSWRGLVSSHGIAQIIRGMEGRSPSGSCRQEFSGRGQNPADMRQGLLQRHGVRETHKQSRRPRKNPTFDELWNSDSRLRRGTAGASWGMGGDHAASSCWEQQPGATQSRSNKLSPAGTGMGCQRQTTQRRARSPNPINGATPLNR